MHVEARHDVRAVLAQIRATGVQVGLSLNPPTRLDAVHPFLDQIDLLLVMSVNPGWGGQPFLAPSVEKVRRLQTEARAAGSRLAIEVDGGVEPGNAGELAAAGAEILVAGTAIYGADDPAAAIGRLREAARATVRV